MLALPTSRMASRLSPSLSVCHGPILAWVSMEHHASATSVLLISFVFLLELELDEEGTRISLTIVDTPGFGDQIDNEARLVHRNFSTVQDLGTNDHGSFSEIVGYLERQYDDILAEESRIKRNPRFRDNRVHAMLYFITPTGHG
jgi:septin family protein